MPRSEYWKQTATVPDAPTSREALGITESDLIDELSGTFESALIVPYATGVAATDTAAWTTAINAALAAGYGKIVALGGVYVINAALPTIDIPTISIEGPGARACVLAPTSAVTTHVLRILTNPFVVTHAGRFVGFKVDGASAAAGACGIHLGDIIGLSFTDVVVENFDKAGSVGWWLDNTTDWTERMSWRNVWANNNETGVLFDVNGGNDSFAYNDIDVCLNVNSGQVGIAAKAAAVVVRSRVFTRGNVASGGSTATWLKLSGNAHLENCDLSILGELTSGAGTSKALDIAAGSVLSGQGIIDLASLSTDSIVGTLNFNGWFNTPTIANGGQFYCAGAATVTGALQVVGNLSSDGAVLAGGGGASQADPSFWNNGGSAVIAAATGANLVILRPNGAADGTGQAFVDSAGKLNVNSPVAATAGAIVDYMVINVAGVGDCKIALYAT